MDDTDALVRTVLGEAGGETPEGQRAVAAVILNRARRNKASVRDVVTAPGQFESWGNPGRLNAISSQSDAYQQVLKNITPALQGEDPTGGADHFYAPKLQQALGRQKPAWDDGSGVDIGGHRFLSLSEKDDQAFLDSLAPDKGTVDSNDVLNAALAGGENVAALSKDDAALLDHLMGAKGDLSSGGIDPKTGKLVVNIHGNAAPVVKPADYGATDNLASHFTFGLSDKAAAGSDAIGRMIRDAIKGSNSESLGDRYDNALASIMAGRDKYREANPITNMAMTGAGLVSGVPASTTMSGLRAALTSGAVGGAAAGAGEDNATPLSIGAHALGGAVLGGTLHGVIGGGNALMRAVRGDGVNSEIGALAQRAGDYGINLRGSQITGSPPVKMLDSVLSRVPGSGMHAKNVEQAGEFTGAIAREMGENTPRITPEVMSKAKARTGGVMDAVAARNPIPIDDTLLNHLATIESEASQVLPASEVTPIKTQLSNILEKAGPDGTITGESYQAMTRKGSPLDRAMNSSDTNIRHYAGEVRSALDDALQRNAQPGDAEALQQARYQYKVMKTIEPLVEKSADGTISPALLQSQVAKKFGNMAYDGGGAMGDLARIGKRFIQEPGSSNTAERTFWLKMLGGAGLGGGAITGAVMNPVATLATGAGLASTAGAANLLTRALSRPGYRNALIDAALNNNGAVGTGADLAGFASAAGKALVPYGVQGGNRLLQYLFPEDFGHPPTLDGNRKPAHK